MAIRRLVRARVNWIDFMVRLGSLLLDARISSGQNDRGQDSRNLNRMVQSYMRWLTGLAIKEAGFVAGHIEIHILLVDPFVAVHPILLRVIPHRVVPPVK